jgi:hypothetical protein
MSTTVLNEWSSKLRNHPDVKQYRVPGTGNSYPLLAYVDGQRQVRYMFHAADPVDVNRMHIAAPVAAMYFSLPDFNLISYFGKEAFSSPVFDPQQVSFELSLKDERRHAAAQLRATYDLLVDRFPDQPSGTVGQEFDQLIHFLVPEILMPFYYELSPQFWEWITD